MMMMSTMRMTREHPPSHSFIFIFLGIVEVFDVNSYVGDVVWYNVTKVLVLILLLHWFWGWWTSILSLSGSGVDGNGDIRCNMTLVLVLIVLPFWDGHELKDLITYCHQYFFLSLLEDCWNIELLASNVDALSIVRNLLQGITWPWPCSMWIWSIVSSDLLSMLRQMITANFNTFERKP